MKILFKLTSRSRPDNFFRALDSILENITDSDFGILCSLDEDDQSMNNPIVMDRLSNYATSGLEFIAHFGKSKSKIDAINRDLQNRGDWQILVNVSDDQVITVKGFDEIIRANMPADLDCFLHFRDTNHNPPDALCTLSILGRKYFERDGFIYDPRFKSYFCDNLAQDIAKAIGKYKYIPEVIFDHLHPGYGKGENDAQYKANDKNWNRDAMLYKNLKRKIHLLK
jgi:hypothetical protein